MGTDPCGVCGFLVRTQAFVGENTQRKEAAQRKEATETKEPTQPKGAKKGTKVHTVTWA